MTNLTEKNNDLPEITKIEIKHYRQLQAQMLVLNGILMFFFSFVLINSVIGLVTQQAWETLPWICLFSGLLFASLYVLSSVAKTVIRLESTDHGYQVTTLFMRKHTFKNIDVIKVLEGYGHCVLVLANGRKLNFDKTDRYGLFDRSFRILDNHPWLPFIIKKRFPNATFQTKRVPW